MNLDQRIEIERQKLPDCKSNYERLSAYNNIIQLKIQSGDNDSNSYLFEDIKNYLKFYILSVEEGMFGYYELIPRKIEQVVANVPVVEQLSLLRVFQRELKINGYEEKLSWLEFLIKKRKIQYYWENLSFRNALSLLKQLAVYNLWSILISIFLIFGVYSIILLPAFDPKFVCFNSTFSHFSDSTLVNHVLNTLLSFCSIESDFKANPTNVYGVIIVILFKLIMFVLILNYLFEALKSKIKL